MKNLWQDLDNLKGDACNPVDLVEEQSDFLHEGTNGLFFINIISVSKFSSASLKMLSEVGIEKDFSYRMELCSSALPDYSFVIFNLYYGISFYPLMIKVPREIGQEIMETSTLTVLESSSASRMYFVIESEEEFENTLGMILNSEKVRTVLRNMKTIIGNVNEDEE